MIRLRILSISYQHLRIESLRNPLFLKGYGYFFDFTAQWGSQFRDLYADFFTLWETESDCVDDSPGHMFENMRRGLHLFAYRFEDGQVIDRIGDVVGTGRFREIGFDGHIDQKTVTHHLLERIASVAGVKLHIFQFYDML